MGPIRRSPHVTVHEQRRWTLEPADQTPERLQETLRIHAEVDERVRRLHLIHGDRLQCRKGCASCCIDDLTVFEVEAQRIREWCSEVLAEEPYPEGACAFLDGEGACRIYEHRPYVCRTQGLPLRWYATDDDGKTVEWRDICERNETGAPIVSLPDESCWLVGPVEARLVGLQASVAPAPSERVRLRGLFGGAGSRSG